MVRSEYASIARPAISTKAFGAARPSRWPLPAATMIADAFIAGSSGVDERRDSVDHGDIDVAGCVVLLRARRALAGDKQMIEPRQLLELDARNAVQSLLPDLDILVDHLVVARSVQDQDRDAEGAGDRNVVAVVKIIV